MRDGVRTNGVMSGGKSSAFHHIPVFRVGLVDDGQWTRIGCVAFWHTTSIEVCLFANFIRSNIHFLSFRFKYTNCHTVNE